MAVIPGTLGYIAYKTEVGLILVPLPNLGNGMVLD